MYSWRNMQSPEYEEILTITRSLHLSQVMDSYFKQRLISHKIVSKTVDLNLKVLWFAPTRPMNENNMYGNVSFTLDWKTALEQFGPNLYFIDQQHNRKFYYVRVLLTNKNYEFLTPVDDGRHGMPVDLFNNKLYAAPASKGVQYVLEIGVAVDYHGENWLYRNCKIEPNDHSSANTLLYDGGPYNPCICHRFNHFKMECPSPFNLQHTKMVLDECCPQMFCNEPAKQSARSHVKKTKTMKRVGVVNDFCAVKNYASLEKRRDEVLSTGQKMLDKALVASRRWSTGQKMVVGASVAALSLSLSADQKLVAVVLVLCCYWPLSMEQKMVVGTLVAVLCWSMGTGQKMVVGALVTALYWPLSDVHKMVVGALVTGSVCYYLAL